MQGKTEDEIFDMTQQAFEALRTLQPPQPAAQPAAPAPSVAPAIDPYSDNFGQQLQSYTQAIVQQTLQQQAAGYAQPLQQNSAMIARELAARDPTLKPVFDRYGNEVDMYMASVPVEQRNLRAYQMAAKMVKGEHVDEFARERVQTLMQSGGAATERVSGVSPDAPVEPAGDELDQFWASDHPFIQRCKRDDVTKQQLRDTIRGVGLTPKQYIESAKKQLVIVSESEDGRKQYHDVQNLVSG